MLPASEVPSWYFHSAPPSYIALFGHSGSQAPQLMHSSVIIIAINSFVEIAKIIKEKTFVPTKNAEVMFYEPKLTAKRFQCTSYETK
jgi:hypothetical protein